MERLGYEEKPFKDRLNFQSLGVKFLEWSDSLPFQGIGLCTGNYRDLWWCSGLVVSSSETILVFSDHITMSSQAGTKMFNIHSKQDADDRRSYELVWSKRCNSSIWMISNLSINSSEFQITHDDYLLFGALLVSKGHSPAYSLHAFAAFASLDKLAPQNKVPSGVACWPF